MSGGLEVNADGITTNSGLRVNGGGADITGVSTVMLVLSSA